MMGEFVLSAVRLNGRALYGASDELKADREVVLAAVQQSGTALNYAAEALKADRKVVAAAMAQANPHRYASCHSQPSHALCAVH